VVGVGVVALVIASLASTDWEATGITSSAGKLAKKGTYDIGTLSESLFTRYLFAFELTSVLLLIAVVGAVVLSRRSRLPEIVDPGQEERAEEIAERIARAETRAHVYDTEAEAEAAARAEGAAAAETEEEEEVPV
jgi:NADH-quinone oxidoreductase subunit J